MKKILILGAYGQIARVTTELFLQTTDAQLTLYLRNASRLAKLINNPRIHIIEGDVMSKHQLKLAMQGQDVVYANLSGNMAEQAKAIIDAMYKNKVQRLIFISSMGIYDEVAGKQYGHVLDPYRDSAKLIEQSDINYTILRPAWLNDKDEITYGLTHKGDIFINSELTVSRKSVADIVVKLAMTPDLYCFQSLGIHKI